MKCWNCGNDNEENAQFCVGCGANLIPDEVSVATELPMVGFSKAVSRGFSNYLTFSGRATRAEFWWWALFMVLPGIVLGLIDSLSDAIGMFGSLGMLRGLFQLTILVPSLAVGVRRLHDINRTGWWSLLWLLIPIGPIVLIVWAIKRGDERPNQYGLNPRQSTSQ